MDSKDMQVIGLCRFSYPALGGFQVKHDTPDERAAYLYSPARMEERFRSFEYLTLPPLRAQTDPDFIFIVLIGDDLPAPYRARLAALLQYVPQAVLVERRPGRPHRAVMEEVINSHRDDRREPCLQFRMDDDDAVSIHFVAALRAAVQDIRPLLRKNRHVAIDFNQGWIVQVTPGGLHAVPTIESCWTAGLVVSVKKGIVNTVMNFGHTKLSRYMPLVSIPGQDMFLRGYSDGNDSRQKNNVQKVALKPLDRAGEQHLLQVYNIDVDAIRASYPPEALVV
jgi:hypothetical protein